MVIGLQFPGSRESPPFGVGVIVPTAQASWKIDWSRDSLMICVTSQVEPSPVRNCTQVSCTFLLFSPRSSLRIFQNFLKLIIEPHSRGVPEAGLPSCGLRPHLGRLARGERSLSMAEGTPSREVLFLLYPPSP